MGEKVDRDFFRQMVRRHPEYKDGRLTDEQAEGIAERLYVDQEEIVKAELKATISRELIRMQARGEAEYDPETDTWRAIT